MGESRLCTFKLNGYDIGVEVLTVREVLKHLPTTRVPRAPAAVGGLVNLRGEIVTAIDLRRRFGFAERAVGTPSMNVVVRAADGVLAFVVDAVGDVVDASDADFEPPPDTLSGEARRLIRGAYKLKDRLLLALDAEAAADFGACTPAGAQVPR